MIQCGRLQDSESDGARAPGIPYVLRQISNCYTELLYDYVDPLQQYRETSQGSPDYYETVGTRKRNPIVNHTVQ